MTHSHQENQYMQRALQWAVQAENESEVPVGAVLVHKNQIIAEGYNQLLKLNDPTAHAEIMVLRKAGEALKNYRLLNTTLYVTLEPCAMCFGALVHARVSRVVFAATDRKAGCLGGMLNLFDTAHFNHRFEVQGGLLENEAAQQLKRFFRNRRKPKGAVPDNTLRKL